MEKNIVTVGLWIYGECVFVSIAGDLELIEVCDEKFDISDVFHCVVAGYVKKHPAEVRELIEDEL